MQQSIENLFNDKNKFFILPVRASEVEFVKKCLFLCEMLVQCIWFVLNYCLVGFELRSGIKGKRDLGDEYLDFYLTFRATIYSVSERHCKYCTLKSREEN